MAVYTVNDKKAISHLFKESNSTMVLSCLQGCMGVAYSDSKTSPKSAQICIGDFICFAGEVNEELLKNRPENLRSEFSILVPQNQYWQKAIQQVHSTNATPIVRYSTKHQPELFDLKKLRQFACQIKTPYTMQCIDHTIYNSILHSSWAADLCCNFQNYNDFAKHGLGVVVLKEGEIVSGASSYTYYRDGIEIEIDTREDERRKGHALSCGAKLILACLDRGLYPSWDAHDKRSMQLAEMLGYQQDKEYAAFELVWPVPIT